jgi:hypothetical protein
MFSGAALVSQNIPPPSEPRFAEFQPFAMRRSARGRAASLGLRREPVMVRFPDRVGSGRFPFADITQSCACAEGLSVIAAAQA